MNLEGPSLSANLQKWTNPTLKSVESDGAGERSVVRVDEGKSRRIVMKVLAINGSHRKGKNTATMLRLVLEELEKGGAHTELLEISDLKIEFCNACNRCLTKTECSIQNDDVPIVAEKMMTSGAIIIGSPVYFGNVTGKLKAFMDRTRWMHMSENLLDGKLGAALTHAGLRNGGQEMTQLILERFLQHHGLRVIEARDPRLGVYNLGPMGTLYDSLVGEEIHWKKGVMQDSLTVKTCRILGQNLLGLLQDS
jgi:multimeric flavodoxin WrbA